MKYRSRALGLALLFAPDAFAQSVLTATQVDDGTLGVKRNNGTVTVAYVSAYTEPGSNPTRYERWWVKTSGSISGNTKWQPNPVTNEAWHFTYLGEPLDADKRPAAITNLVKSQWKEYLVTIEPAPGDANAAQSNASGENAHLTHGLRELWQDNSANKSYLLVWDSDSSPVIRRQNWFLHAATWAEPGLYHCNVTVNWGAYSAVPANAKDYDPAGSDHEAVYTSIEVQTMSDYMQTPSGPC